MKYRQTPTRIIQILELFHRHRLNYILFKCEHIFAGENKNVDILFETNQDYKKTAELLEKNGFIVRLSEKIEKYKTMYTGLYENNIYSFHLHREIAWHGIIALDKREVFKRKKVINSLIIIPSVEDSLLIHAAHILFENFKITEKEKPILNTIEKPEINRKYLEQQIKNNKWEYGFKKIIKQVMVCFC